MCVADVIVCILVKAIDIHVYIYYKQSVRWREAYRIHNTYTINNKTEEQQKKIVNIILLNCLYFFRRV